MESNAALGSLCDICSMRHNDDRGPLPMELFEESQDFITGIAIKRPGRLVGQEKSWLCYECTCNSNTLLLASRKLIGPMVLPMT